MADLKYLNTSVGGHCALELINTQEMVNGVLTDRLQDDAAVITWVEQTFMLKPAIAAKALNGDLLAGVLELRAILQRYLSNHQLAKKEFDHLNKALSQFKSYQQLVEKVGGFASQQRIVLDSTEALIGLIADAVCDLIALGDLALIRKCESDDCVLWFYDTTKGHKRRWCSMATCGNRHKIRKFRAK
ncbi:CGNR zinc finger domain-containing protein [Methylophilus flavus]|uniref:CGNR zinc finger domain-containing protein n=1 Tax=Methylophilus flavus TaxID=640084 RepID=A0ABW3PIE2_9PROT